MKWSGRCEKRVAAYIRAVQAAVGAEDAEKKAEWDKDPGWPAKLVETRFVLNGIEYTIQPQDLGLTDSCWDQGFMESFQGILRKDLEAAGATKVYNLGFLD